MGAIARLVRGILQGDKEAMRQHPSDLERAKEEKMLILAYQGEVKTAWEDQKLRGLLPFYKEGVLHTTGRFATDRLL